MAYILVVEDNEAVAALMWDVLIEAGYQCSVVPTVARARAYLDEIEPDLIISDIVLPGETGLSLAADLQTGDIPVLLTSGNFEVIDELGCHNTRFLQKPFRLDELLNKITAALKTRSLAIT